MKNILIQLVLMALFLPSSWAVEDCNGLLTKAAKFLHSQNQQLHMSTPVVRAQARRASEGRSTSQKPIQKIEDWLESLGILFENMHSMEQSKILRLYSYYLNRHIIRPQDIPQTYYDLQVRLAREQGHGTVTLSDTVKNQLAETLIKDQKNSLKIWLRYFFSSDASVYPIWAKYWAFTGVLKLGIYDLESGSFSKRTKSQVAPFADLNHEALAMVFDVIIKKVNGESLDDLDKNLVKFENFGKLYALALKKLGESNSKELKITDGRWIKYNKGSDAKSLSDSLQGHNTGWCTAGQSTAQSQLRLGDFYVYYSNDTSGRARVPRLAIRMDGGKVAEIRGINENQHLDSEIAQTDILDLKLEEFGDEGKSYFKKKQHMERLTAIDDKVQSEGPSSLSKDELLFLYEVDEKIQGFGYGKDPRVYELLENRDFKEDLSYALGIPKNRIGRQISDIFESEPLEFFFGDLMLDFSDGWLINRIALLSTHMPKQVSGNFKMKFMVRRLPKQIHKLKLPEHIGGDFSADIMDASQYILPEYVGGAFRLKGVVSSKGWRMPKYIGSDIFLTRLESIEGLVFPERVNGTLDLYFLSDTKGIKLPSYIQDDLFLSSLENFNGVKLPESVDSLYLTHLKNPKGLKFPSEVRGSIELNSIKSLRGLPFPKKIGGDLNIASATSLNGVTLPESIGGDLFTGVTNTTGMVLPNRVGGYLNFSQLKKIKDYKINTNVGINISMWKLKEAKNFVIQGVIDGGYVEIPSLMESTDGITLPAGVQLLKRDSYRR